MHTDSKIFLREACEADADLLFGWANDSAVRANSFHTDPVTYEEHVKWFQKICLDVDQIQFILMDADVPVGQIRLSRNGETAEIGYSIAADKRGKGYGTEICRLLLEKIEEEYTDIQKLVARVKPSNTGSMKCFEKNGFEEVYRQYQLEIAGIK